MIVLLRVPQGASASLAEPAPFVDVQVWWPDEWGLPREGQRVSVEEGRVRVVQRVVLEPGGLPSADLRDHRQRGTVRIELEAQETR